MTRVDKSLIRERMLALEAADLEAAREQYEAYLKDSQLEDQEAFTTDEISVARETVDIAHALEGPAAIHGAKIAVIRTMDFGPKAEAEAGAVVSFGGKNFVLSVATGKFEAGGQTFMGIAIDSPVAQKIASLGKGDTFEQNGRAVKLKDVY
jgi:hypothetical protein